MISTGIRVANNRQFSNTFTARGRQNDFNYWFDQSEYMTFKLTYAAPVVNTIAYNMTLSAVFAFRYPYVKESNSKLFSWLLDQEKKEYEEKMKKNK